MTFVTTTVLATVNAPYGTSLSAEQLASKIADPASADHYDASAFAFFSDVSESLQHSFLDEMHVNLADASVVARRFSDMAGYELPLARAA
ncbi:MULTISPECIES: hypothetical protein [Rhizobium/Agrobacterium group]|uniref:Uncharacterized protein n=2 Tax=Neorhizobium TaxID=1525371 RepID=A0ABV0M5L7_9HYPH|nr:MULTISPECIES: hypothetical protein [Rhizobium/Agrobacterium group]KGD89175.1 hypothetical protein JL39_23390 [Rhizobium sp. YS-1r]MCC2609434.1 hypothetical protein [Neorhizobium petrolearium]WGI69645.1 hypothetical protein QEO92_06110 [Neorhizobium petrolearium]